MLGRISAPQTPLPASRSLSAIGAGQAVCCDRSPASDSRRRMRDQALQTQAVSVADLRPYPANPRRGNVEAIKASLRAHGQYRPIVVNRPTMQVLAGNHTLEAVRQLGWKEIAA